MKIPKKSKELEKLEREKIQKIKRQKNPNI